MKRKRYGTLLLVNNKLMMGSENCSLSSHEKATMMDVTMKAHVHTLKSAYNKFLVFTAVIAS